MKIFPDFGPYCTYAQAIHSDTALSHGLSLLAPSEEQYENMVRVYQHIIVPVAEHFGIAPGINSFFRSSVLQKLPNGHLSSVNAVVGGSKTSDHPNGRAVDLSFRWINTPYTNIDLGRWIRDNLDFDQLIVEKIDPITKRPAWVHVGYRSENENRHQVLQANFTGDKASYVPL